MLNAPRLALSLILLSFFSCARTPEAAGAAQYPVAMRTFGVWTPEAQERFDVSVWHPGMASGAESAREGWIVETGRRGRVVPGFYPVILLSHDTASCRFANNDLAAALAAGGFIVIAPTHMGDNQNDSGDLYTARLLRARPRHLLRALEAVLDSPDFALYADESRIGLIGVGFGAITIAQLAGANPDPAPLETHCQKTVARDAFCAPWAAGRLARLSPDMALLEKETGKGSFTPPLDLYAPELTPAPIIAAPQPPERQRTPRNPAGRSAPAEFLPDGDEEKENTRGAGPELSTPPANLVPVLDFQGGPFFGGTDSGGTFVHIALPDSPHFRVAVADDSTGSLSSPELFAARANGAQAHRRPPSIRRILGFAFVAPAGGMMFSREALSGLRAPVALIEAGRDALYPARAHAWPFRNRLPAPPELLSLADADHFSLFAHCSRDTAATLGEACGRLVGNERAAVAAQRDRFLLSFFRSVLGEPLPPASPSGYIATQPNQ